MKRILYFSLIAMFCIFLFSCSQNNDSGIKKPEDQELKRIAFVSPQTDYPVWLQAKIGFEDSAEDFGFYSMWLGGGNCDIDDMIKEIDIAIAENVDAVITCPLTPSRFISIFKKLNEKDIPLITIAVDAYYPDTRAAYIGSNYQTLGQLQAESLCKQTGDHMRIGVIMSTLSAGNQVIQVEKLQKYIKDMPDAEIVDYEEDYADSIVGMNVLTKMLEAHPEINAIFVTSGGAISNYGKILEERNLTDDITLIGMDIIQENIDSIKAGQIYGVMSQDFYSMGYLGGRYAYEASCGKEIPEITYTDSQLVTKENADSIEVIDISED